ncbi:hypothetical protein [Azospirillum halopraeferens]|uniref:hypothetical protein n=1 Tax=Azospirillum halopraeferens TaxID=34010 RepID=UPI000419D4D9|nr:hypothetical protein [Azospirillum halopraeferens]
MIGVRWLKARAARWLGVAMLAVMVCGAQADPAFALRVSTAYWKTPQDKILHYWIDAGSFPDADQLALLRANLTKATDDWENICRDCGIRFIEVANRSDATFLVVGVNVQRAFLADGFNPSDPRDKWVLKIDRSYFNPRSRFDKIGVLRHELGHILGYRHEQIVAPEDRFVACGWKTERNTDAASVIALTAYDPESLMHYPCGIEAESVLFGFSPLDIDGHRRLYGPNPVAVAVPDAASPMTGAPAAGTPQPVSAE